MFAHPDLNLYLLQFLDRPSLRLLLQVNQEWYGVVKSSPYYPYLTYSFKHAMSRAGEKGSREIIAWLRAGEGSAEDEECIESAYLYDHPDIARWVWYLGTPTLESKRKMFLFACLYGDLQIVKELDGDLEYDRGFLRACQRGHLEIAQYLYSLVSIDDLQIYFNLACEYSKLNVAKWLYSLAPQRVDLPFTFACACGHVEVAEWLHGLGGINHHDDEYQFLYACKNGHLEMAKWLASLQRSSGSLGGIDHHVKNDYAFRHACANGHLEVAKWLASLSDFSEEEVGRSGGIDHDSIGYAFRHACANGHLEVAKWLASLSDFSEEEVGGVSQPPILGGLNLASISGKVYTNEVQEWLQNLST
jgi:hypothetical protein